MAKAEWTWRDLITPASVLTIGLSRLQSSP